MLTELHEMTFFERKALEEGAHTLAGIDEAGRGPLAGPVVAGACIFSEALCLEGLTDSKKLSEKKRQYFLDIIQQHSQIHFAVGIIDAQRIDEINIYQATKEAMYQALEGLSHTPDYLLVDGMNLPYQCGPSERIVKGDARSFTIAAASIVAKETRDAIMLDYDAKWPEYGFKKHKGYPTRQHIEALKEYGPCPIHRRSYKPVQDLL